MVRNSSCYFIEITALSQPQRDSYAPWGHPTEQRTYHAGPPCKGRHLSEGVAEQRDPYGVTEQRVRHAVGISLGARRAERPLRGDRIASDRIAGDRVACSYRVAP